MTYEIQLASDYRDIEDYAEWLRKQGHTVTIGETNAINIEDEDEAWEALTGFWDDYRDQPLRDENGWLIPRQYSWLFVG